METIANKVFFEHIEAMIAESRCVNLRIKGHSMRPLLRNEVDQVILHPVMTDYLRRGDIVLFRCRGRHIMHRIVAREGEQLTLAGDGNYRQWESCTTSDVVAIVRQVIRPDGEVVDCSSRKWRLLSRGWLLLPQIIRRYTLSIAARIEKSFATKR